MPSQHRLNKKSGHKYSKPTAGDQTPAFYIMTENHYDLIMDCLNEFDFDKVSDVMTFLNWTWGEEIPTVQELRANARKYLKLVIQGALESKEKEYITATGGFRYECKIYEDGFVWLRMAFEVTDWDNCE